MVAAALATVVDHAVAVAVGFAVAVAVSVAAVLLLAPADIVASLSGTACQDRCCILCRFRFYRRIFATSPCAHAVEVSGTCSRPSHRGLQTSVMQVRPTEVRTSLMRTLPWMHPKGFKASPAWVAAEKSARVKHALLHNVHERRGYSRRASYVPDPPTAVTRWHLRLPPSSQPNS